jgi:hypothetical protein
LFLCVTTGFWYYLENEPGTVTLRFIPVVAGEPLEFNKQKYKNPGGGGIFKIRDFRFYISNIRLNAQGAEFVEPDSYHLVRFDDKTGNFSITLKEVPRRSYQRIRFGIGIDESANKSIEMKGDLDPNSRMAWNWEVGYKFVLFEGGLILNDNLMPLVYHVGFGENYRVLEFKLDEPDNGSVDLIFQVDIMAIFNHVKVIDMAATSNVKFDRSDARTLANNYEGMISLTQ